MGQHEEQLLTLLEDALSGLPDVTVHSQARARTTTLLLTFTGRDATEASKFLAERDVLAPSSNFYALEASRVLGLGEAGGLRVGLAPYTSRDEVERLIGGLTAYLG
ncbi:aminotransferase class V-fold PLP-dependent enzyme [Arthrobacter sp. Br18]|uniref:aminotransferase class V-fold PLP-dependent enzyme n=1 Tax=Arthrobacter sp. Br18 TaxID=1312954 RepID=UPI0023B78EA7|nr:aminotransferase class V-fold PLP-dependent enzyme [Arthrobacter sp. Br18]